MLNRLVNPYRPLAFAIALIAGAGVLVATARANAAPALHADSAWSRDAGRPVLTLASEKGRCIYRCRIRREECSQDNAAMSRSDDVCWDAYATCRGDCGDSSAAGAPDNSFDSSDPGNAPPRPGAGSPDPDFVQLEPSVLVLGKWVEGLAFDGNSLWAAESGQRTVARIDLNRWQVAERLKVGRLPVDMASMGAGDVFALVHTDKLIWGRNPAGQTTTVRKLGECPEGMIEFGQSLWVLTLPNCSSETSRLTRLDLRRQGAVTQTGVLGQWAQALVGYDDKIFIAHAREPALTIVDSRNLSSHPQQLSGASLWAITANSSHIFAGGREDENNGAGLIVMYDPRSEIELARALTLERISNITADQSFVVAVGDKGTIWIYSAEDLELRRTITLTTGGFDSRSVIFHEDNLLIAVSQYQGENGAVFAVGNWRPDEFSSNSNLMNAPVRPIRPAAPIRPVAPVVPRGQPVGNPSFNCATNRGPSEQAICASQQLSALDREMAGEYELALSNITSAAVGGTAADVANFRNEQRNWLRQRSACGSDQRCIGRQYRARLRILRQMNEPE